MTNKKEKVVYWADKSRTWGGTHNFGDEVTGLIDAERLEKWLADGTVSEEKQHSVEMASQSKLMKLEIQVESKDQQILDLKAELKATPKNTRIANEKLKLAEDRIIELESAGDAVAASAKIEELENQITDKDIEVENLGVQVTELTATIETQKGEIEALTAPKDGK